jgi:hypothetical protein
MPKKPIFSYYSSFGKGKERSYRHDNWQKENDDNNGTE